MFIEKAYIYLKIHHKTLKLKKKKHVMKNISESQYKTKHAI